MGGGGPCFGDPRIRVGIGIREIYVSHIDVSWVQCYKTASRGETIGRFARGDVPGGQRKPKQAAGAANLQTGDCRAAFRQTYWTSAFRKSMSWGHAGME